MKHDFQQAEPDASTSRRNFVRFLAASPLLTSAGVSTLVGALTAGGGALAQSYDVLRAPASKLVLKRIMTHQAEFVTIMRQVGALRITDIKPDCVTVG